MLRVLGGIIDFESIPQWRCFDTSWEVQGALAHSPSRICLRGPAGTPHRRHSKIVGWEGFSVSRKHIIFIHVQ